MARDHERERIHTLEVKIKNLQMALGSQARITEELRASHDHSIRMISDAIHRADTLDLGAILASLDFDPERAD